MSAPNCLRCLVRSAPAISASASQHVSRLIAPIALSRTAPFSTTAPAAAAADKGGPTGHVRAGKKMKLGKFKKNKVADKTKPPLPGERKAYRKRITLSNDNAIPVPWLTDIGPGDLLDPGNVAKVLSLPEGVQDQLRACEAFKPTQCWNMFRKPSVLVRSETVDLMGRIQKAIAENQTARIVLTGEKVTGKSLLLLQAMAHAYVNDWIVIHVPDGQIERYPVCEKMMDPRFADRSQLKS